MIRRPRTRGRAVRAGAAGFALMILGGLASPAAAATGPSPSASAPETGALPALLTLNGITPVAPQPGDTIRLTGTLRNTSPAFTPLQHLSLGLYFAPQQVSTRGEFDQYAARPATEDFAVDGLQQLSGATVELPRPTLAPGASERWSISLPISALGPLQPWEVYRLAVAASTPDEGTVGRLRTFLPYAPTTETDRQPLSVSWLWPLVDLPHENVVNGQETFTDDGLAGELTATGRLTGLLDAAGAGAAQHPPATHPRHGRNRGKAASPSLPRNQVPVTFAVDPMLLAELSRMAASPTYTVREAGKTRRGTGRANAAAFISRLKGLLSGSGQADTALALPYADPDLVAAVRSGQTEQLGSAYYLGNADVARVLGLQEQDPALLAHWAWPPDGYADRSTLDALFSLGIQTLVLDSAALPPAEQPAATPNAHVTVSGRLNSFDGVLTDDTLSQAVSAGAVSDSGLALQRYLAETLMIQAQSPSIPGRSIVIAPARRWSPPAGYATRLLTDSGRVPWLRPIPLQTAARASKTPEAGTAQLDYPRTEQHQELSPRYVAKTRMLIHQVNQLGAILPSGSGLVKAGDEAILQALSSAWRGDGFAAIDYRKALEAAVEHTVGQVKVASHAKSLVTLTSHSGSVPITIYNGLNQPVRVGIRLTTLHRLSVTGGEGVRTIPPHQRVAVDVRATANVSGDFPVYARLTTPGPKPALYGHRVLLFIRSTAYGTTALAITGAALAVLLVAVAIRLARRAMAARRAATAG